MRFIAGSVKPLVGKMSPLASALLLGGSTFFATMAIRVFIEKEFYLLRWWTFRIADPIGFPIFGWFAAKALKDYVPDGHWSNKRFVRLFFCLLWWGLGVGAELDSMKKRGTTLDDALVPSQAYHTVILGPVGALICSSVIPLLRSRASKRTKVFALSGLALWPISLLLDTFVQDRGPGR